MPSSEQTLPRLRQKWIRARKKLTGTFRAVNRLLPQETADAFKFTPPSSLNSTVGSQDGAAALSLTLADNSSLLEGTRDRLNSNTSMKTVWSEGEKQVHSLKTVPEELNVSSDSLRTIARQVLPTGANQQFFVMQEYKVLEEAFESHEKISCELLEAMDENDPNYGKVEEKMNHFQDLMVTFKRHIHDHIEVLCQANDLPLPGTPDRWSGRQNGANMSQPDSTSTPASRNSAASSPRSVNSENGYGVDGEKPIQTT